MNTSENQVQELPMEVLEKMEDVEANIGDCRCGRNRPGLGPFVG